jgi:hypothetical protein
MEADQRTNDNAQNGATSKAEIADERTERGKDVGRVLNGEEPLSEPTHSTGNTDGAPAEQAPPGVGETSPGTARGEHQSELHGKEPGRSDEGTQGPTDRPVGSSDERDLTGVNPTQGPH